MKHRRITKTLAIAIAGLIGLLYQGGLRAVAQPGDPNGDNGAEVLTRGPIHEAFAQPGAYNARQGVVIRREAPAAIEEIPPDERPDGNALWIPGYWQYDDDRADFIWVSGIWRLPPPDQSWVPGYWTADDEGWIWTPGFWMAAASSEVEYLPQPPTSIEVGPSSPAPSANHLWAPGCWSWTASSRYAWRPGYWMVANVDWIWEPSRYSHTPRGYVYSDGYWDRPLERRGVLFAPVYFERSVYSRPNYVYSPTIVIETSILTVNLFVFPRYHEYRFGDYYEDRYSREGYVPWFEYHTRHQGYDPIYAHERWRHERDDSHWDEHVRDDYRYRAEHVEARPAITYKAQAAVIAKAPENRRAAISVAAPLAVVSARTSAPIKFQKIDEASRKTIAVQAKEVAKYRDERSKWETNSAKVAVAKTPPKEAQSKQAPAAKKPGKEQPSETAKVDTKTAQPRALPAPTEATKQQPKETADLKPGDPRTPRSPASTLPPKEQPKQTADVKSPQKSVQPKATKAAEPTKAEKVKIPKSPVVAKADSGPGGKPPARPTPPKPDPKIQAKPAASSKAKATPKPEAPGKGKPEAQPAGPDKSKSQAPHTPASSDAKDKEKDKADKADKPDKP